MMYIFEDEKLYESYDNKDTECWVLSNDSQNTEVKEDIVISQSFEPLVNKVPKIFMSICDEHPNWDWNYKVFVRDKNKLRTMTSYVCPVEKIIEVK